MFPLAGRCLFPVSPDDAAIRFCGSRCRRGSPYCRRHRGIAYIDDRAAEIARIERLARLAGSVETLSIAPDTAMAFLARLDAT